MGGQESADDEEADNAAVSIVTAATGLLLMSLAVAALAFATEWKPA